MASDHQTRRLLFAGHSHCRRLADFVRLSPARVNFGFALNDIRVEFCAQGGAHVDDLVKPHSKGLLSARLRNTLLSFRPDVVCLLIGDNDVSSDSSADEIANYIIATASFLRNVYNVDQVILFQLLPRYPAGRSARTNRKVDNYNAIAADINSILKQECVRINFLHFWDDHDFSFPSTREVRNNNAVAHVS